MEIIILGDVGASDSNQEAFRKADNDLFSADIQKMCMEADVVLLNLEKPLTDHITPLGKCPPDYVAPTETINGIKLLHPTVVTLANNHIMDQREQGLRSTMDILSQNGIQYVGAGNNMTEARKAIILERENCKVGIYACCEKEFSFATKDIAGANVFDPLESLDEIAFLKQECDYLIVLHHGGMQGYPYPTPYLQKVCRKMCEKGADLVVCQHSHIIGCEENYSDGVIVYGQGNLLLDDLADENWQSGLILRAIIKEGKMDVEIIPTEVVDHKTTLHHSPEPVKQAFLKRSREIRDEQFVQNHYMSFCRKKMPDYLMKLSGTRLLFRKIIQKLGISELFVHKYQDQDYYYLLDYLYCDAHREAISIGAESIICSRKKSC